MNRTHGTLKPMSKLTEADVREAREVYKASLVAFHTRITFTELAKRFGVSSVTIQKAIDRETWTHVE